MSAVPRGACHACAWRDGGGRAAERALVRIRTTVLDKLLNQVGEVSISRARLDNEIGAMQGDARELGEELDAGPAAAATGSAMPHGERPVHEAGSCTELAKAMDAVLALHGAQKRLLQRVLKTREGLRLQGRYHARAATGADACAHGQVQQHGAAHAAPGTPGRGRDRQAAGSGPVGLPAADRPRHPGSA
jgi:hypothetical protein